MSPPSGVEFTSFLGILRELTFSFSNPNASLSFFFKPILSRLVVFSTKARSDCPVRAEGDGGLAVPLRSAVGVAGGADGGGGEDYSAPQRGAGKPINVNNSY